jgi:hypothetical protein
MKRFSLGLVLIVGLGSSISSAWGSPSSDPFDQYLRDLKAVRLEPSLVRFARECGIDSTTARTGFAVNPGGGWIATKSLAAKIRNLDSDFFSSAQLWRNGNRSVVEIWSLSLDVGSQVRVYRCFEDGRSILSEAIDWNIPVVGNDPGWGYSRQWKVSSRGASVRTKAEFVDERERVIPRPKLDADGVKSLSFVPSLGPLRELKLPPAMLK